MRVLIFLLILAPATLRAEQIGGVCGWGPIIGGGGGVSWPLTATDDLDMDGNNIDNAATLTSAAADPADGGAIRLGNAEDICYEASPASTDICVTVDTDENWVFDSTVYGTDGVSTAAAGDISFDTRAILRSPAAGQYALGDATHATGAVLDIDDYADTVYIKDLAGTGAGDLGFMNGSRIYLDTDRDTYFNLIADDDVRIVTGGVQIISWASSRPVFYFGMSVRDDANLYIGNNLDYWFRYTNSTTRLSLNSTNCNGGGTDCDLLEIVDGTNAVVFPEALEVTGTFELPNGTALPATCNVGQLYHDTDSDDCADTGSGDGALCICKTSNTWALINNF